MLNIMFSTIVEKLKNKEFKQHILTEQYHVSFSTKEDDYFDSYQKFLKSKNGGYVLECEGKS